MVAQPGCLIGHFGAPVTEGLAALALPVDLVDEHLQHQADSIE
ncbi:hypothetical protein [Streptomyces sp. NPDC002537]